MTNVELRDLLVRAEQATRGYASAIDTQLYRVSGYYAEKERPMYDLADELERAIATLEGDK